MFIDGFAEARGRPEPAPKPAAKGLYRLRIAAHVYRVRVRERPFQEALAAIGLAAGVALLFAVQVASTSVAGSFGQFAHGIAGRATLELAARGPAAIDQSAVARAARVPGVAGVAPVLRQRVVVAGPRGSAPLALTGVDERLTKFGGPLVTGFAHGHRDLETLGFYLTSAAAREVGAKRGTPLVVWLGTVAHRVVLAGVLGDRDAGALADLRIAVAPLGMAQRLAGSEGRVTRVLVAPAPGRTAQAETGLRRLAADRFDVRPSDTEAKLLAGALKADRQSSLLFSVLAIAVSLIFAYNAVLLAMPRRRHLIALLRMVGADRKAVLTCLVFDALVLGVLASIAGLVLGDLLSLLAMRSVPHYISSGFLLGPQRVIAPLTIAITVAAGIASALLASLLPAHGLLLAGPAAHAERHDRTAASAAGFGSVRFIAGVGVIAVSSVMAFARTAWSPFCIPLLVFGVALAVGPLVTVTTRRLHAVTRKRGRPELAIAVDELAGTPIRAGALALIAAGATIAVIGVAGARLDLQRGIHVLANDFMGAADVWIEPTGKDNAFITQPFDSAAVAARVRRLPEVRSVSLQQSSFLDFRGRRARVIARPPDDPLEIVRNQFVKGDYAAATRALRAGGAVALSDEIARGEHIRLGQRVAIPTPRGTRSFVVVATIANYGWPSGAILLSSRDFASAWGASAATALTLKLAPGVDPGAALRAISRAVGPSPAVHVATWRQMVKSRESAFEQGLARMKQISVLIVAAGILAVVAAMFASVAHRTRRLAAMRAIGLSRGELLWALFSEAVVVVLLGGVFGAAIGLILQYFAERWVEQMSGYALDYRLAAWPAVVSLARYVVLAAAATLVPALQASKVDCASIVETEPAT